MILSKSAEYAMRSIVYVALHAKDKKIGIKEISKELELPSPFAGKILQQLVRHGLLASAKGPNGGFFLSRPADQIPLMDIVRVIDGIQVFKSCGLGLKDCSDLHPCPLHNEFKYYREGLKNLFNIKTIQDLVVDIKSGKVSIHNFKAAS
jgi:Rrf2 family protein